MAEHIEPVEPVGSGQPVPSLADAWVLLLRSAAVQLRRLRPAPRPTRAPARAARSAAVPAGVHRGRRRISPREALTCLLLLLAIFGATGAMTWWSWQTLQDRQVHLGGPRDLRAEPDGRSLTGDLVKSEDRSLEAAPAKKKPGSTVLERPAAGLPGKSGGDVSLDGRIVAGGVIATALGGATLLSRLVLRRYRQRAALASRLLDRRSTPEREIPAVPVPEQLGRPDVLPELWAEDAAVPDPDPAPADDGSRTSLLVEQRQPLPEESLRTAATPDPASLEAVSLSAGLAASASATAERLELSGTEPGTEPGGEPGSWPVQPAGPADADSYDVSAEDTARERIFDRRASRRLPYVQPAWLWWADQNAPVTVQDISLTGLRCVLSLSPGAPALQAPPLNGSLRIFFPVSGTTVKAAAQLLWKEQTPRGTQMGLEFVDLPEADAELLRQLLLAAG